MAVDIYGRGYAGIATRGSPNIKSMPSRPDIAGADGTRYKARNNGIKIRMRRARTKTRISNPKI